MSAIQSQEVPQNMPQGRGIPGLWCPECHQQDCVRIRVHDASLYCVECEVNLDAEETLREMREQAEMWTRLVGWLEAAPIAE